jgi:predicted nucleic acid-binding Zn ribbon protein
MFGRDGEIGAYFGAASPKVNALVIVADRMTTLKTSSPSKSKVQPNKAPPMSNIICAVCGKEISYTFGRPRRVCSHECYLMWKRKRYYRDKFLKRMVRISKADLEFEDATCECGSEVMAWTLEGVFCTKCGLESRSRSLEPWLPSEFVPTPACRCSHCKKRAPYLVWLHA